MPGIASLGWEGPPRRAVITGIPAAVAAATVLGSAGCTPTAAGSGGSGGSGQSPRFFSARQAAVVEAATARIAPGPEDDPAEAGHPGAREAGVTGYIDAMLGALATVNAGHPAPMIFASGPWSNRHTSGPGLMARFVALDPVAKIAWRKRLVAWQDQYHTGIATLDRLAVPLPRHRAVLRRGGAAHRRPG